MKKNNEKKYQDLTEVEKLVRVIRIYLEWLPVVFVVMIFFWLYIADNFFNMIYRY